MICEHCSDSIEGIHVAHSAVAVLQKVTPEGYTFYQCEDGQEYAYVTYQHFSCTHEHMIQNFGACVSQHYSENLLHPIPSGGGITRLHKIVLRNHLVCIVCQSALEAVAYRFCISICTPINSIPDDSHDQLGGWCCSLEHARQSALSIISSM
jgi:hypothetical protein